MLAVRQRFKVQGSRFNDSLTVVRGWDSGFLYKNRTNVISSQGLLNHEWDKTRDIQYIQRVATGASLCFGLRELIRPRA